jgi:hypothetical protein
MTAGTEVLKAPKTHHTGVWLLVATIVLLVALATLAVVRLTSEPSAVPRPNPAATAEFGYVGDVIATDTDGVSRPCVRWGECEEFARPPKAGTMTGGMVAGGMVDKRACLRLGECRGFRT